MTESIFRANKKATFALAGRRAGSRLRGRMNSYPLFQPMHGEQAIFRVIGGLPASIDFGPKGVWSLSAVDQDRPPYSVIRLEGPKNRRIGDIHFSAKGHAEHVLLNGTQVDTCDAYFRFFLKLVLAGKAEVVCGPHVRLYWMSQLGLGSSLQFDARYTWKDPQQNPHYNL